MTKDTQKKSPKRPQGRPAKSEDAPERSVIGARVPTALYQRLVDAAATNRNTIAAEIERRLEKSFEPAQANPNSVLDDLGRHVMAAFEAGGRRASRLETKQGGELPTREWIEDPGAYTEAASRALEVLADWHPEPDFGLCMLMIYSLTARLDQLWNRLLMELPLDEAKARKKRAQDLFENMTPAPSLHGFRPTIPGQKGEG